MLAAPFAFESAVPLVLLQPGHGPWDITQSRPQKFHPLPAWRLQRSPPTTRPPASTSKLTPFVSQPAGKLVAAGPAFLAHIQLTKLHGGDFKKYDEATAAARAAATPVGEGVEDDLGVGDESEDEALLALDPKEWKKQDQYRVLGLSHLRWTATPEQIKIAHRKKVLRHHPDKKASDKAETGVASALGLNINTNDDAFFKCIQKAHEVLTNAERRRQFDSVDPQFLEEIDDVPTEKDFKSKNPPPFLPTFAPIFKRESRFSRTQPVPGLAVPTCTCPSQTSSLSSVGMLISCPQPVRPQTTPTTSRDTNLRPSRSTSRRSTTFWYNFDSWRSFEWLDKEVNEGSDSRDDKRYTEKKNKSERARRKKEDIARVRGIVDLCLSVDPRIKHIKQQEKEMREAKKAGGGVKKGPGGTSAAQAKSKKEEEEAEKARKEEEEKAAKAEAKKAKAAAANAAKKARRAQRAADEGAPA
ncbi:1-cys peroxiredoxin [Mycena venus]|uniref:1-cys peroxiredoxin n=1 Tax=Mycena venus TaxID=2733690 RepID=A0A8H6WXE4_9AGAR|nr:1-cys peroxiredoxin [Mycena venus]